MGLSFGFAWNLPGSQIESSTKPTVQKPLAPQVSARKLASLESKSLVPAKPVRNLNQETFAEYLKQNQLSVNVPPSISFDREIIAVGNVRVDALYGVKPSINSLFQIFTLSSRVSDSILLSHLNNTLSIPPSSWKLIYKASNTNGFQNVRVYAREELNHGTSAYSMIGEAGGKMKALALRGPSVVFGDESSDSFEKLFRSFTYQ